MTRKHALFVTLAAAGLVAACSSPSGPKTPEVATVTLAPLTPTIFVGGTTQLSASLKASDGSSVTGVTVTWSSSAETVATVSASGLVTGVAAGQAAITATAAGVSASTIVTVSSPQQACDGAKTVTLASGESQIYQLSDCIILPSGSNGDRYRVAVIRNTSSGTASDVPLVTLSLTGLGVTGAPAATGPSLVPTTDVTPLPGLSSPSFQRSLRISESTERFHMRMRAREADLIQRLGTSALLHDAPTTGALATPVLAASPPKITIDTTTSGCTTSAAAKTTGILISDNAEMAIYQDSAQHQSSSSAITKALADQMLSYYSTYAKDMVNAYWGKPTDLDNNGRVILFVSPVASDSIAAFVWSGDFFSNDPAVPNSCAASNMGEIIYFNASLILDMVAASPAYQALSTVAHEMKHVVSLYDRVAAGSYHPSWIEEGTAEISGEMSSRIAWAANGGPALNVAVTRSAFQSTGSINENNYGVAVNLARAVWFLSSQPNGLVVTPAGAASGSSIYGSGWLFHRWLGDAYGNTNRVAEGDSALFRALTDSLSPSGVPGITAETGKSFDTLLQEFYTTILLHQTLAPQGSTPFFTYDFVTSTNIFCNPNPLGVFPWPVTTTGTPGDCNTNTTEISTPTAGFQTKDYTGPIGDGGVRIYDFLSNGTGTGAQIRVDMTPPGEILVVRIR